MGCHHVATQQVTFSKWQIPTWDWGNNILTTEETLTAPLTLIPLHVVDEEMRSPEDTGLLHTITPCYWQSGYQALPTIPWSFSNGNYWGKTKRKQNWWSFYWCFRTMIKTLYFEASLPFAILCPLPAGKGKKKVKTQLFYWIPSRTRIHSS